MGFYSINAEQKVRISLSYRAEMIITEDMRTFFIKKRATIINTIIENFHEDAKASISNQLAKKRHEYEEMLADSGVAQEIQEQLISHMLTKEQENLEEQVQKWKKEKWSQQLYHINQANFNYLKDECNDEEFYNHRVGLYLKCLIEEYATLPFVRREEIIKQDIYNEITNAIRDNKELEIETYVFNEKRVFHVSPYDIVYDPFHSQAYLACYSREKNHPKKEKIIASFSIAKLIPMKKSAITNYLTKEEKSKLAQIKTISSKASLSNEDKKNLNDALSQRTAPYLLGEDKKITVRLTENGKRKYQTRLYTRPQKLEENLDETISSDEYHFQCPELQAYQYFFPFGADAEIISPPGLRNSMLKNYQKALDKYEQTK